MATNLVSYVMQFLTPDMIGRIAPALGLNRGELQSGVSAGVPGLLAAFSDGWGPAWHIAARAGLPPYGPLMLPGYWRIS